MITRVKVDLILEPFECVARNKAFSEGIGFYK